MVHNDYTKDPMHHKLYLHQNTNPHYIINSNPNHCSNYNKHLIKNDFLAGLALSPGTQTQYEKFWFRLQFSPNKCLIIEAF